MYIYTFFSAYLYNTFKQAAFSDAKFFFTFVFYYDIILHVRPFHGLGSKPQRGISQP